MLLNNVELDLKTKRKEGGVSQAGIAEKPGQWSLMQKIQGFRRFSCAY